MSLLAYTYTGNFARQKTASGRKAKSAAKCAAVYIGEREGQPVGCFEAVELLCVLGYNREQESENRFEKDRQAYTAAVAPAQICCLSEGIALVVVSSCSTSTIPLLFWASLITGDELLGKKNFICFFSFSIVFSQVKRSDEVKNLAVLDICMEVCL